MHRSTCCCPACCLRAGNEFEVMAFRGGAGRPVDGADELALAMELLEVSSEAELDRFLGKMFKSVWKGVKKVGSTIGRVAQPLAGALKAVAKTALPFVGGALGSFIPIPGVGTAIGTAVGGALARTLEMEAQGMLPEQRDIDMARRFVRFAADAAREAAQGEGSPPEIRAALIAALGHQGRQGGQQQGESGTWRRRGERIVLVT
ncbi:MAG TPA: hypothetical protein VF797_16270 [Noviherbaspirillum sp.]